MNTNCTLHTCTIIISFGTEMPSYELMKYELCTMNVYIERDNSNFSVLSNFMAESGTIRVQKKKKKCCVSRNNRIE